MRISVIGGGTGLSCLLRGLKKLPFDISAIVSVCDDGSSTGRLREEFNTVAVGDIRKVLISLSSNEDEVRKLLDYRFDTSSDLNGHAIGNLILTAASNICGNMSSGIELVNSLLDLKGKVIPLTEDNVTLAGEMESGEIIYGEHNITEYDGKIKRVFYDKNPCVSRGVIESIKNSDAIILSMGSIFTSIIPNLLCDEVISELDSFKGKIIYVCNIMTQPGETDEFSISDHVNLINSYLGNHKLDVVVINNGLIDDEIIKKYETKEQKDLVKVDMVKDLDVIENDYIKIENGIIRHDCLRVSIDILSYLLK